jgi:hypothetical protein
MNIACKILVGKPERMRPLRRPRGSWEDNIRMRVLRLSVAVFQVEAFWFVTLCSVMVGYHNTYPTGTIHDVITQKTST